MCIEKRRLYVQSYIFCNRRIYRGDGGGGHFGLVQEKAPGAGEMISGFLSGFSSDEPQQKNDDGNNEQNVNDAACVVGEESDGPGDDQDDCNNVQ
jgi:hypothetical protein